MGANNKLHYSFVSGIGHRLIFAGVRNYGRFKVLIISCQELIQIPSFYKGMNFKEFTGSIDVVREKLLRYALWVTGTRGEAEDIVQETFIRMWKMKKKLHEYDNLENLGKRIIKNLSIDIFRSRRKFIDIDSAAFNPIKSPEEEMINNENFTKLKNIIRNLGEPYHTVLYLRAIEGRDIKEISKIINAKHNTVEVILSRARKKIREEYKMMDYGNKIK